MDLLLLVGQSDGGPPDLLLPVGPVSVHAIDELDC
jgi:hypothetical protein